MPFWVYVLRCADESLYVGHTKNLEERVATHNAGRGALLTRMRRPVAVVYSDHFANELDAIAPEAQIKRWSRTKKEALILGDMDALHEAARRRS
jgi:tRNA/rRNA methyltransferase